MRAAWRVGMGLGMAPRNGNRRAAARTGLRHAEAQPSGAGRWAGQGVPGVRRPGLTLTRGRGLDLSLAWWLVAHSGYGAERRGETAFFLLLFFCPQSMTV